jgi:excisionase family DNA binding protein
MGGEMTKQKTPTEREYLSLNEVADIMGVHYRTVRSWVEKGELEAIRFGRMYRVPKDALPNKAPEVEGEAEAPTPKPTMREQFLELRETILDLHELADTIATDEGWLHIRQRERQTG